MRAEETWPDSYHLALEIVLDAPQYLEGEPIHLTAIATNAGSQPIRYLPVIYTSTFKCIARRSDGETFDLYYPVPSLTPEDHSSRLEAGASELYEYFLNFAAPFLPPGDYVMQATVTEPDVYEGNAILPDEAIVVPDTYSSNQVPFMVLASGGQAPQPARVVLNGRTVSSKRPVYRLNSVLMAGAGAFEAAGVTAAEDKDKQAVTLTRGDASVTLPLGRWPKEMQGKHPPAIPCIGGGLLVPVRYVAESLGMKVTWDPKTKTANILTG